MQKPVLLAAFAAIASIAAPAGAQFCPGAGGWVFDDVLASDPFCSYITWAAQNEITGGCQVIDASHRLYCPVSNVSRLQMAAFLNRLVFQQNSVSPTVGTITKPGGVFLHNFGVNGTFLGVNAGNFTMTGSHNTAVGFGTLSANSTGLHNTAVGAQALQNNTTGGGNTATGLFALGNNDTGTGNSAVGWTALSTSTTGGNNTAVGSSALVSSTGSQNTALGSSALNNSTTGSGNIAIGASAGTNITTGSLNVSIANPGTVSDSGTIRIGTTADHTRTFIAGIRGITTGFNNAVAVVIDSGGQLGTVSSSRDGKDDIADMSDASAALMQLRPVTFHYKADHDPAGPRLQYGLVAEEVAGVYPGMVAANEHGKPETVMYQYLAPMLLNEFQKQQRTIHAQAREIAELKRAVSALIARTAPETRADEK